MQGSCLLLGSQCCYTPATEAGCSTLLGCTRINSCASVRSYYIHLNLCPRGWAFGEQGRCRSSRPGNVSVLFVALQKKGRLDSTSVGLIKFAQVNSRRIEGQSRGTECRSAKLGRARRPDRSASPVGAGRVRWVPRCAHSTEQTLNSLVINMSRICFTS
jgi:hypothetical protein